MDSIVQPEEQVFKILPGADPALKLKSVDFDFASKNPVPMQFERTDLLCITDAKSLAKHLRNVLVASRGIGVSAPQISVNLRVIAAGSPDDPENIIVAFNPVILDEFGGMVKYEEGCLSFPGLFLRIRREANIRVRYTNEDGITDTIKLSGLSARVFQHEIDHLEGILFTERADSAELHSARNKQKQMHRRIKAMRREQQAQRTKQHSMMKRAAKAITVVPVANTQPSGNTA